MVPLNNKELNIDLIKQWNAPVILVSQNYLGSINHTLLSVSVLRSYNINLLGIIFNGPGNSSTENFILQYTGAALLGNINKENKIDRQLVNQYAGDLKRTLSSL
jgi:dethiobiotin synthetase